MSIPSYELQTPVSSPSSNTLLNNATDGINPVIYDTDGSIINQVFGPGASGSVLGFAGSAWFTTPPCHFAEGRAVINGSIPISDTSMTVTIAHEIGHLIGMDHTQIDSDQGLASSSYPLMYPVAFRGFATLHEDDEAAVTELYPGATMAANYGQISGTFTTADGVTPVRGANIWAQETSTNKLYSIVSDYRIQNSGFYRLRLPPGTYRLRANAIRPEFDGGSSVGPYTLLKMFIIPAVYRMVKGKPAQRRNTHSSSSAFAQWFKLLPNKAAYPPCWTLSTLTTCASGPLHRRP